MVLPTLISQSFVLKGRIYTLTVMKVLTPDLKYIAEHLDNISSKAPKMFQNLPFVLDCTELAGQDFDLAACCQLMYARHMYPVAVQGADDALSTAALALNLAPIYASQSHDKTLSSTTDEVKPEFSSHTRVYTQPIRSGQQCIAQQGDLIVTRSVSQGAELMAQGNIHVYGTLRGRALAGMSGDTAARIFCLQLDAELVSIAGIYRLRDSWETLPQGPCQIFLRDEQIHIELL